MIEAEKCEVLPSELFEARIEIERLRAAFAGMCQECDRAWREVDFIAKERNEHLSWRTHLYDKLQETEAALLSLQELIKTPCVWMQSNHLHMFTNNGPGADSFLARCSRRQLHADYVPLFVCNPNAIMNEGK